MSPITRLARLAPCLLLASLPVLVSCASTATTADSPSTGDILASPGAVAENRIVLVAHGMACPKCVTNADLQLMKLPGVASVRIDMQHGILDMTLDGSARPSRAEIAKAIDDAGLTLVSVEGRTADGDGS